MEMKVYAGQGRLTEASGGKQVEAGWESHPKIAKYINKVFVKKRRPGASAGAVSLDKLRPAPLPHPLPL